MRDGGRIAAAAQVLEDVLDRRQPVKSAVRDWGKKNRYAGAKDRAWISGLVLDALRRRNSVTRAMDSEAPRSLVIGTLAHVWNWDVGRIDRVFDEEHAPSPLTLDERERLVMAPDPTAPAHVRGDFPAWMEPHLERAFGEEAVIEAQTMAVRASVDLRVNTLKTDMERAEKALKTVKAVPSKLVRHAFRIPAPDPSVKSGAVESIPAYSKGWVEVQDIGSQIAAAAANATPGMQILDYCAGGGGKSLAMAAAMNNQGQIYAYDIDGRRLSAIIPRLKRAGIRNVQLRHPQEEVGLDDLKDSMDLVVIDAPCSGVGTWRRRPDAKWRLTEKALERRMEEQASVLENASVFVKPGGQLLYVTCSFLKEENEDQVSRFLKTQKQFVQSDTFENLQQSGLLTEAGLQELKACRLTCGALRLTPRTSQTDGFYIAVLRRD